MNSAFTRAFRVMAVYSADTSLIVAQERLQSALHRSISASASVRRRKLTSACRVLLSKAANREGLWPPERGPLTHQERSVGRDFRFLRTFVCHHLPIDLMERTFSMAK